MYPQVSRAVTPVRQLPYPQAGGWLFTSRAQRQAIGCLPRALRGRDPFADILHDELALGDGRERAQAPALALVVEDLS